MTSLERIRCAARRQAVDRVPVAPYMGNHGARVAGVPIGEYCRSGRLMAEAQYRAWQVYGQDAVVAQSDNYYIAEGFGVEVEHYLDSTPTLKTPTICELDGVQGLRVPNPRKDGRMPVYLEAISRLAGLTRGEVAVQAGDSLASVDMISPATYRKWAWPAERRFFEAINPLAERCGAATVLVPFHGRKS
jgi:uroporphyrinogen decarboxylase